MLILKCLVWGFIYVQYSFSDLLTYTWKSTIEQFEFWLRAEVQLLILEILWKSAFPYFHFLCFLGWGLGMKALHTSWCSSAPLIFSSVCGDHLTTIWVSSLGAILFCNVHVIYFSQVISPNLIPAPDSHVFIYLFVCFFDYLKTNLFGHFWLSSHSKMIW